MVFVDMESVHFYEPPTKAAAIPKKSDSALITSVPTLVDDGNSGSDPVKIFDISGSPLEEFAEPFFPWPLDSKCNVDVRDHSDKLDYDILAKIQEEDFTFGELLAEPGFPYDRNEIPKESKDDHYRSIEDPKQEPSTRLVTIEEPLKVQSLYTASLESGCLSPIKVTFYTAPPSSHTSTLPPETSSDTSTLETISDTTASISNTAAIATSPFGIFPPECNGPIPSIGQTGRSNNMNKHTDGTHDGGAQGGKDMSGSGDSDPPLPAAPKQHTRSAVGERHSVKRRRKPFRFTSPLSSDEDSSSYVPVHTSKRQKANASRQSSSPQFPYTAVIYEQQSWEGEIVDERDVQRGRGRPRKQYLIQWNRSWVDGNRLNEPSLLQSWRERKAENF